MYNIPVIVAGIYLIFEEPNPDDPFNDGKSLIFTLVYYILYILINCLY